MGSDQRGPNRKEKSSVEGGPHLPIQQATEQVVKWKRALQAKRKTHVQNPRTAENNLFRELHVLIILTDKANYAAIMQPISNHDPRLWKT